MCSCQYIRHDENKNKNIQDKITKYPRHYEDTHILNTSTVQCLAMLCCVVLCCAVKEKL